MKRLGFRRRAALTSALALTASMSVVIPTATATDKASSSLHPVASVPALPAGSRHLGLLAGKTIVHFDVVMRPRSPSALARFVQNTSTPGNPQFRRFLAKGEFANVFGPSAAAVRRVEASLRSSGLNVASVSPSRLVIDASGTERRLAAAFHTSFQVYSLPSGRIVYAPSSPPSLDAALARWIQAVTDLDDVTLPTTSNNTTPRRASPHSADSSTCLPNVTSKSPYPGYWTPVQIAEAYDMEPLYGDDDTGGSIRVALYETGGFAESDIAFFEKCLSNPKFGNAPTSLVPTAIGVDGQSTGCTQPCDEESVADIETLLSLAPGLAGIDVYESSSPIAGYGAIADGDDPIVSTSVGSCESSTEDTPTVALAEQPIFEQMASQGQAVFAATGDEGSEGEIGCNNFGSLWDPSSQPTVTAVGGTELDALGTPPSAIGSPPVQPPTETVYNDRIYHGCPCAGKGGAGGGGISTQWLMPTYQTTVAENEDSSGTPCGSSTYYCRETPDVSASASGFHGYAAYFNSKWVKGSYKKVKYAEGGTSLATPTWAAIAAMTMDYPGCNGMPLGPLNPLLYQLYSTDSSVYFNDISATSTSVNNDWTGAMGGKYPVLPGYDMATGLGSPVAANLAAGICDQALPFEGSENPGSGGIGFGTAVADQVVGAPGTNHGAGAVYVMDPGEASLKIADPTSSSKAFGSAVAGDPYEFAAGAPLGNGGLAYVYFESYTPGQGYSVTSVQKLTPAKGQVDFGSSVALDDGYIAVGAPNDTGGPGVVYLYLENSNNKYTLVKKIIGPASSKDAGEFGNAVAISDLGQLIVGDEGTSSYAGSVIVYQIDGSAVTLQQTLVAPDGVSQGYYGSTLSSDSDTLAVGAPETGPGVPGVYAYSDDSGSYSLEQELNPAYPGLANPTPGSVAVHVFERPYGCGGYWIAVGMPTFNGFQSPTDGQVFLYQANGTSWTSTATFEDPDQGGLGQGEQGDDFGSAMGDSDGSLLIGAPTSASGAGQVDVFGGEDVCP
jgi:hypothetical protein